MLNLKTSIFTFFLIGLLVLDPTIALSEVGIVVLEDTPGCDHFVVETSSGYSLLEWYGGVVSIWEGDKVFGELHSYGFKDIYIEGRGEMRVWIEDYWMNEREALKYFYSNCR
jgi:hypothetical protein